MRKTLHFDSPRERYKCDAAVVWCFDNRFELVLRKLLKHIGVVHYDPIRIAGGTKCLASPDHEGDREFLLRQVRLSMRLHETDTVILMLHSDCGPYGGLAVFEGDAEKETRHHLAELQRATACLKSEIPELSVKPYFVDFEGVWEAGQEDLSAVKIA